MSKVSIKRAPALRAGARVRLIAPASPFDRKLFAAGLRVLARLGFEPVYSRAEFERTGFLAGSDRARAARLQKALLDKNTQAVWCIRGGYGTARILPHLDLSTLRKNPKVLIGFSDITALLLNLSVPGGYATFHGPVITQLGQAPPAVGDWLAALASGRAADGLVPLGRVKTLRPGRARGRLLGGNLSVLASLAGTPYFPDLSGAILFVEDTGEQAYRLDRLLVQLRQTGALDRLRGVIVGALSDCRPAGRGRFSARAVVERAVSDLGLPAVSGAAFGHVPRNMALPVGVQASLDAAKGMLEIGEPAVR